MKKSNISSNKLSELMADKEIRISGETIVAFSQKKKGNHSSKNKLTLMKRNGISL